MDEKIRLSHSKLKTFLHCRKRYVWEYIEHLTPIQTSKALQVGGVVHDLLHKYYTKELTMNEVSGIPDLINQMYPGNTDELTDDVASESARLMAGYIKAWEGDPLNVISSELWVEVDVPDEENVTLSGRVDALARNERSKLWRLEHKTAARMDSSYLNGLKNSLQGAIYDFLTEATFEEAVEGTIYNLLVKTKIPKFERSYTQTTIGMRNRMLETVKGVIRSIRRKDFYPSNDCFVYNRSCDFRPLCDHDSKETREAFYKPRTSPLDVKKGK